MAALLIIAAISSVRSQTVESTIFLPDSCGGLGWPSALAIDIHGNRLFVAGTRDDRILIIHALTKRRIGYIPAWAGYGPLMTYNPANGRLYCRAADGPSCLVIDPDSSRVVRRFEADFGRYVNRLFCDSAANRVYCLTSEDSVVGVIDGQTDSAYATHFTELPARVSSYDSIKGTWSGHQCRSVTVDSGVILRGKLYGPHPRYYNPATRESYLLSEDGLQVINERDSLVARIPVSFNSWGCYSPRHNRIYCPSQDQLAVVDVNAKRVVSLLPIGGNLGGSSYSAKHDRVYLADREGQIVVVDPKSTAVSRRIRVRGQPYDLLYYGGFDRLWFFSGTQLTAIDCTADTVLAELDLQYEPWGPLVMCLDSLDGKLYCSTERDSSLYVIDAEQSSIISRLKLPGPSLSMCLDHKDRKLYCALGWDPVRILVIDTRTDTVIKTILVGDSSHVSVYDMYYSPATGRVYCAMWGRMATIDCGRDSVVETAVGPGIAGSIFYSSSTNRVYSTDVASVSPHTLWAREEASDSIWEVKGVDRPSQIQYDGTSRLFVSGSSRIYIVRDE